jgi:hypothetical protein
MRAQKSADLLMKCRKHEWSKVAALLNSGADANAYGHHRVSALMIAASKGQQDVCDMLLSKKANVNHADDLNGRTALMYGCSSSESPETIAVLLDGRADANRRTEDARTALMMAADVGSCDTCLVLLTHKADVNAQAASSEVCHKAMGMHSEVVSTFFKGHNSNVLQDYVHLKRQLAYEEDFLMSEGHPEEGHESPGINDYMAWNEQVGEEPLSPGYVLPSQFGSNTSAKWKEQVLEASVETSATTGFGEGQSFMEFSSVMAGNYQSLDCWQETLSEEPPERNATGFTPPPGLFLSKVAPLRKQDMVKEPMSEEEHANARKETEHLRQLKQAHGGSFDTALTIAARRGDEKVCELLLVHQADVNLKDSSGETAVEIAAKQGHHEVCKVLLRNNPPEEIQQSALRLARAYGKEGSTAVLCGYDVLAA